MFPIRETIDSREASTLQLHEIQTIRNSKEMQTRLISSLDLILKVYGMSLAAKGPGYLIEPYRSTVYACQHYKTLQSAGHPDFLTRIFKSLVELGQPDYVPSIILFILAEQSQNKQLRGRELVHIMDSTWVYCMRDTPAQHCVADVIMFVREQHGRHKDRFTMKAYREILEDRDRHEVWPKFNPIAFGC